MRPVSVAVLAALTAAIGVLAVYQILSDLYFKDRSRLKDRVDEEFLQKRRDRAKRSPLFKNLGQFAAEALAGEEKAPSLAQRFESLVEQSGLDVTPGRILALCGLAAAGLGSLAFAMRRSPIDGVFASGLGAIAPLWYLRKKRNARIEKLRSQLPEAFELMGRVVRSGQTLAQALIAVADEFPPPIATEFGFCYEQQNLGLSPEVAFRDLARRAGVIELRIFVLAVLVQQQTGGNLSELLAKLSTVVRDRYLLKGTINTLTAEGRMQGWVLAALPPLMLVLMFVLNPSYAGVLFEHPRILLGTFGFEILGALWIRKIVNFDF